MELQDASAILECPECKQNTIKFDKAYRLYNCTNETCKLTFSEKDFARRQSVGTTTDAVGTSQEKQLRRAVVGNQYFDSETGQWKEMNLKRKSLTGTDRISMPELLGAIALGSAGAALGGVAWYFLYILTNWQIGFLAIGIGWLVGYGVVYGAGRKRAQKLQWISVVLTLVALLAGEYFIMNHYRSLDGYEGLLPLGLFFKYYAEYLTSSTYAFFDIIFFAIAMYSAYRVPTLRLRR